MPPAMPAELILYIISQLDPQTEKSTLSTCSLICSTFQIDAQRRLFASTKLVVEFQKDPCHIFLFAKASATPQKFLDAISKSPHLASFVHDLEIQVFESSFPPTFEHWLLHYGADTLPIVDQSAQLINILRQLHHLQAFSVTGTPSVDWHSLEPSLKRAFLRTIRRNSLGRISVVGLEGFRIGSFYKSLHLRHLTLRDISSNEAITAQLQGNRPCSIPLACLTLDTEFNGRTVMDRLLTFTRNPACPITLSKLTHLTILSDDISRVPKLLFRCANSLTHLTFCVPRKAKYSNSANSLTLEEVTAVCPPLDLRSLHNLRSLSITKCRIHTKLRPSSPNGSNATSIDHVERTKSSLPWVAAVLATVATEDSKPLSLAEIEINLCLIDVAPSNLESSAPWHILMNPLLGLYRDHGVRHRFIFTAGTHHSGTKTNLRGGTSAALKILKLNSIFNHFKSRF
ncbi:hypothetical protein BJ165DRAFT_1457263 [Panaeolus papilionaceus]|nr:hypothetical protein BJ165DRAFT_1457263 [Panaeolus papilionaceus]